MKALVKKYDKPGLWLEDVPVPTIQSHEVLIKVKKSAICGTDIHIWKWDEWARKNVPVPLVVGHEFMGEIVEIGSLVQGLSVGQRVAIEGHLTCGVCPNCRKGLKHICFNTRGVGYHVTGNFSEYFAITAENVFPLSDEIPDELAAIFDPFGNATHTALSFDLVGEDVLITGAGPIGIMAAAIAKHAGARRVVLTDVNPYRLELARKVGIECLVDRSKESLEAKSLEFGIKSGYGVGMEMSGHPSGLNDLLHNLQHGGKIALLGLLPPGTAIDWDLVIFKMFTLKGIYGREIYSTWYKMSHMLESGLNIAPIITHQFPIDEFEKGFEVMMSGQAGKVILNWE